MKCNTWIERVVLWAGRQNPACDYGTGTLTEETKKSGTERRELSHWSG